MTTYYRAKPSGFPGEYPNAGYLAVKETKCITGDNVFVSEISFMQDGKNGQEYVVEISTPFSKDPRASSGYYTATINVQNMKVQGYTVLINSKGKNVQQFYIKPGETITFRYAFTIDLESPAFALKKAHNAMSETDVFKKNKDRFDNWYDSNVPHFETDDPDMLKMYYYRWFVVYRGLHNPRTVMKNHPYPRQAFYEGPGGYTKAIGTIGSMSHTGSKMDERRFERLGRYSELE